MTRGATAYLAAKAKGDRSMPAKWDGSRRRVSRSCEPRAIWRGLDCPKTSLQPCNIPPPDHHASNAGSPAYGEVDAIAATLWPGSDGHCGHSRGRTVRLRRASTSAV